MKNQMDPCAQMNQKGVVLVFALLLLLVLTILGVGTLSSVSMQERMAGNANLQALAFKAASAGVTETLEEWLDEDNWPAGATCTRGSGQDDWSTDWTTAAELVIPGIPDGFAVRYQTRLGCFKADNWELLTGSTFEPPQQLLALSRGQVFRANTGAPVGDPIAKREVEVRLERRGGDLPECLIQICELDIPPAKNLSMPSAKAFSIDAGEGGCPMGVEVPEDAVAMKNQLRSNQVGQYRPTEPGITFNALRGAWGDPQQLARATNAIKIGVRAYNSWAASAAGNRIEFDFGNDSIEENDDPAELLGYTAGTNPFQACAGTLRVGNSTTCPSGPFTYVAGDLDIAGSCTTEGMVIVEGALLSSGTPAYAGNVLLLGGLVDINGFGQAPNSGLLILQHLDSVTNANSNRIAYIPQSGKDEYDVELGKCTFQVAGGGTATITPLDCDDLKEEWKQLNYCLEDLAKMTDPDPETKIDWKSPADPLNGVEEHSTPIFDYVKQLMEHAETSTNPVETRPISELDRPDLRDPDPDNPDETEWTIEFPVPDCAGDPAGGRRNVIASWREFIDQGRWDAVQILN